jgi:peptidyl-prolyl cis-trans isomerase B (cyclophilin B)
MMLALALSGLMLAVQAPSPSFARAEVNPALALRAGGRPAPPRPPAASPAASAALVETAQGSFVIRLLPELAPRHVQHFAKTAKAGGYDATTFHRIIPRGIIQGGDPLSKDPQKTALYGTGGLGLLKAEFSDRPMTRGSVAAVLRPSSKDSAGNQFFICLSDQVALTGKFTIFGEVVEGMDVVDKIGETPVEGDRAQTRVEMTRVSVK